MDFEKLLQQRQAKEAAAEPPKTKAVHIREVPFDQAEADATQAAAAAAYTAAMAKAKAKSKPKATRNRQQVAGSKRSSWKMRAWYVQPETASRLRAYVNRQQEAGDTIDASDVVDQAIAAWLDQQGA